MGGATDAAFGIPAQPFADAGSLSDGGSAEADSGTGTGGGVLLRVFHGIANLGGSYLCHDPSYVRSSDGVCDDLDAGAHAARVPLELPDGALEVGLVTGYAPLPALQVGAITVHRHVPVDGGHDVDLDGGLVDASPDTDAAGDGADFDAEAHAPARCGDDSLEAVLPLPVDPTWLDPDGTRGDGGTLEARGLLSTASGGDSVTLFGSGLALNAAEVARMQDEARALAGGGAEGEAAACRRKLSLEASYGPRFLLSRTSAQSNTDGFALHLSHLIADIPAVPLGQPAPDTGSGSLRLCMTVGGVENSEILEPGARGVAFRNHALVGSALDPAATYRFRLFVQADFAEGPNTCATTSLKPVAELQTEANMFMPGRSYTLVAWGALAADAVCTGSTGLFRAGCPRPGEMLRPQLVLIEH